MEYSRILAAISNQKWAIQPEALENMLDIVMRDNGYIKEAIGIRAQDKERGETLEAYTVGSTRVIPIVGPIMRYATWLNEICGATSYERLGDLFYEAINDPKVESIVLQFDTPGGMVTGCSEFSKIVRDARGLKPVVAYVDGDACSAGYWIASACDHIVVNTTSTLGSIGVVATIRDFSKQDEMRGIKTYEIISTQSPNKRPNLEKDEGRKVYQEMIDTTADAFIDTVAENRNMSREDVIKKFNGGGMFVGRKAVSIGMADEIGTLAEVIETLNKK